MFRKLIASGKAKEIQKRWNQLNDKLAILERDKVAETRVEERFRLEDIIDRVKTEREELEQELLQLEALLGDENFTLELENANQSNLEKIFYSYIKLLGGNVVKRILSVAFTFLSILIILGFIIFIAVKIYIYNTPKEHYEFIIDKSSSMNKKIYNYTKFDIAKEALKDYIKTTPIGNHDSLSLRLFGGSCDAKTNELYNFDDENFSTGRFLSKLDKINPRGESNLVFTIKRTIEDVKNIYKPKGYSSDFVFITSGDDSCCSDISIDLLSNRILSIGRYDFKVNFHFVGILDNKDNDKKIQLAKIAGATGGFVAFAKNKEELLDKLEGIRNEKREEPINGKGGYGIIRRTSL